MQGPTRRCGCACMTSCRCICTCKDHCVCCSSLCEGKCGDHQSRHLIVSIDGTSNQFGPNNTNVVKLHSRILADESDSQLKYYACGIGTYVPHESFKYWTQRFDNVIDLAIAWNFKKIILDAYRWLSDHYRPGDKIFLFGFSRGAYQVGLLGVGNHKHIPFAYEAYLGRHKGNASDETKHAEEFKKTFSRSIKVHFIGVWDTVSSVGLVRGKPLPLTEHAGHICQFRHALALDERRVKFLPEYVNGGSGTTRRNPPNVKEVWFAGTHSDIGGGLKKNMDLNLSSVPLLWMENEAIAAGLRLCPRDTGVVWKWKDLRDDKAHDLLKNCWWFLEILPIKRRSYKTTPAYGKRPCDSPGQLIHASVAFKDKDYRPRAIFSDGTPTEWEALVGQNVETEDFNWAMTSQWSRAVEMDLFDASFTAEAMRQLKQCWDTNADGSYWMNLRRDRDGDTEQELSGAAEVFGRLAGEDGIFKADLAEVLEAQAGLMHALGRTEAALGLAEAFTEIRRELSEEPIMNTVPPCIEATVTVTVGGVALQNSRQVTVTMKPVASKLP
ncbi:hypothetical protein B0H10DRAFT_2012898 [Mycena sp. CBHHK59/15]|nr:hypothetical protein B0H10DRAFT_2012898 [Mycena sp. CBHHK59/15]